MRASLRGCGEIARYRPLPIFEELHKIIPGRMDFDASHLLQPALAVRRSNGPHPILEGIPVRTAICLILLFSVGAASAETFSASAASAEAACSRAKSQASKTGRASGDCDCDMVGAMHMCLVQAEDPKGAKAGARPAAEGKDPYPDLAMASSTEKQRACSLARELFAQQDRSPQACDCTSQRNGRLFMCTAQGRGQAQLSATARFIGDKKTWLRELLAKCDPATDERHCERVNRLNNGGSGRRG